MEHKAEQACMIWMHGLGADPHDMAGLAKELSVQEQNVHHVYLAAPHRPVTLNQGMIMPAWYDISGTQLVDREDKEGIEQSAALIRGVVNEHIAKGVRAERIFLAGFSQGGAMALYTALHTPMRLGGVIALSAYLPLAQTAQALLDKSTPFFLASGRFDPLVRPDWSEYTKVLLEQKGYSSLAYHSYPMEHSVCQEELRDLSVWLNHQLQGAGECP